MRSVLLFVLFALPSCLSQSLPESQPVSQQPSFKLASLGLSYSAPASWTVQNDKAAQLNASGANLVFAASQTPAFGLPFVVVFADETASIEAQGIRLALGDDISDLVPKGLGSPKATGASVNVWAGGQVFKRQDFRDQTDNRLLTLLVQVLRSHLVRVVVSAETQEQRDATVLQLLRNLKFEPDWGANPPIDPEIARSGKPQRVRVSQGVSQGLLEHKVDPKYPPEARKRHIQGIVILHAVIDRDGKTAALWVLNGDVELVPATLEAVSQWRFRPYLLNNEPIQVDTQITVSYTLSGR